MSYKTKATTTTKSYRINKDGIVKGVTLTTKDSLTNTTRRTSNKIGQILPSARQFLAILLFLPIIMLAIVILFDLPNYTFFETVTINEQEIIKFNAFEYIKNIDNTATLFKTMLNNTFAPNTLPDFATAFNFSDIIKAIMSLINIVILLVNLIISLLNTVVAVVQSIVFLFRLFGAIIGLNFQQGTFIGNIINGLEVLNTLRIPMIPYIPLA